MLASTFRESGQRRVGLDVQRWRGQRREAGGAGGPCQTLPVFPPGGNRRGWQGTPKSKRPTAQFPGGPSAAPLLLGDAGRWGLAGAGQSPARVGRLHGGAAALPGSVAGSLLPTSSPATLRCIVTITGSALTGGLETSAALALAYPIPKRHAFRELGSPRAFLILIRNPALQSTFGSAGSVSSQNHVCANHMKVSWDISL